MTFGSWYDHVKGWWEKKQAYSNIHYMFYEDLIEVRTSGAGLWIDFAGCSKPFVFNVLQDPGREVDRLCSFLGLSPSSEEKENVLTGAKFDNMKKNKMTNYSTVQLMDQEVSPFMRKGRVKVSEHLLHLSFIHCFHADYYINHMTHWLSAGKVGDWKNLFTEAQNIEFDQDYKQKMKTSTLQFRNEI